MSNSPEGSAATGRRAHESSAEAYYPAQGGRYDDTLVREDGHWKFKRRVAGNDLPAAPPAAEKK